MSQCKLILTCQCMNEVMKDMPLARESLKQRFCFKDYGRCARVIVAEKLGQEKVPEDLFPRDIIRAKDIVTKYSK